MDSSELKQSSAQCEAGRVERSATIGDLAKRMASAYAKIRNLEENGWNEYHGFGFVSLGQITDPVRKALAEAGVVVMPSVVHFTEEDCATKTKGGSSTKVTVTLDFTWIAAGSGEFVTTRWVGSAIDHGDKAFNKAYSAVLKQALQKTFLVSSAGTSSDDADYESAERQAEEKVSAFVQEDREQLEAHFHTYLEEATLDDVDVEAFQQFLVGASRASTWQGMSTHDLHVICKRLRSMGPQERRAAVLAKVGQHLNAAA